MLGCNFIQSTAVNQLEMWQAETFDPDTLARELAWARDLGMNAVRVFLHDLAHSQDPDGFLRRVERFLEIAAANGIRTVPVLFDDCWFEGAVLGPQPPPRPGVHNSRWLQSPGTAAAVAPGERPRLKRYVMDVVGSFRADPRVLFWDIYNEPGNRFLPILSQPAITRIPRLALAFLLFRFGRRVTLPLLLEAFAWARELRPDQPLTAGTYFAHPPLNRVLLGISDVLSFHNYEGPAALQREIGVLQERGLPVFCTEYLARTNGSDFATHLPLFREANVGCFNWGLVRGKTQTVYSWSERGGSGLPRVWYHDILNPDGSPYDREEIALLHRLSPRAQ